MLISDYEYFVSTAQRRKPRGAVRRPFHFWDAVGHHSAAILILKVISHVSEWSVWSRHQAYLDVCGLRVCRQIGG